MTSEAQKLFKQKILRTRWLLLGICGCLLTPLSVSFAAPKKSSAAKAVHSALVHYRHHSFGIGIFGIMGFPYPAERPTIYAAPPALVYIEKDVPQQTPPEYVWYYCRSLQTYYPYIIDCPEAWEEIKPSTNVENSLPNTQ